MRRPGFLNGFEGFTPKAVTYSSFKGFGYFGKGFIAPPPGAPPAGVPGGGNTSPEAINTKTGEFYVQDPRCPTEGMVMTKWSESCQGADCDPGEVESGEECDDDPLFRELPDPPASGWESCSQYKSAGYPGPCNKNTCPDCFRERAQPKQVQQAQPQAQPQQAPPEEDPAIRAKMAAELQQLEAESKEVSSMPRVAMMAPPSAYTGGGMPTGLPTRARKQAPSRAQQVESIVSDFETRQAINRTTAKPVARPLPPPSNSVAPAPPPPAPAEDTGGLFSWLKNTLFGGFSGHTGLGEYKSHDLTKLVITAIVVFGIIKLSQKKG